MSESEKPPKPKPQADLIEAVITAQGMVLAHGDILRELMIEVLRVRADHRAIIAAIFEQVSQRMDRDPVEDEAMHVPAFRRTYTADFMRSVERGIAKRPAPRGPGARRRG